MTTKNTETSENAYLIKQLRNGVEYDPVIGDGCDYNVYGADFLMGQAADVITALEAELEAANKRIKGYRARLEIDHAYTTEAGGEEKVVYYDEDVIPDGIEARDTTIALLEEYIDRLVETNGALLAAIKSALEALDIYADPARYTDGETESNPDVLHDGLFAKAMADAIRSLIHSLFEDDEPTKDEE